VAEKQAQSVLPVHADADHRGLIPQARHWHQLGGEKQQRSALLPSVSSELNSEADRLTLQLVNVLSLVIRRSNSRGLTNL
jgi:hypothetical protein